MIGKDFFNRPVQLVARELLGNDLCVIQENGRMIRMTVNETEAYDVMLQWARRQGMR